MNGVIGSTFEWLQHPLYSKGTMFDWGAALVLVLILAFLWKTVIDKID
jgi:hypothetical protein